MFNNKQKNEYMVQTFSSKDLIASEASLRHFNDSSLIIVTPRGTKNSPEYVCKMFCRETCNKNTTTETTHKLHFKNNSDIPHNTDKILMTGYYVQTKASAVLKSIL